MAYQMQNANASALFVTSTSSSTVVQTMSWFSDSTAIYSLQWGGTLACPTSVGGTCSIGVTFNGVAISTPSAMQTMTGCFANFGNSFTSNCANQASSGLNTITITAQLSAVTLGQAAKIRETYLEVFSLPLCHICGEYSISIGMHPAQVEFQYRSPSNLAPRELSRPLLSNLFYRVPTEVTIFTSIMSSILPLVPSFTFDQLDVPVFRITGAAFIPKIFTGDSKIIVALRSDVDPSPAVSLSSQSLVFHGVVFQYLSSTQSYIIHSQFCGSAFTRDTCSLKIGLGGNLLFKRTLSDMKGPVEEWTIRGLSSTEFPVLTINKVQSVFQDMYVKRNANSITQLQQKFQAQSDILLNALRGA